MNKKQSLNQQQHNILFSKGENMSKGYAAAEPFIYEQEKVWQIEANKSESELLKIKNKNTEIPPKPSALGTNYEYADAHGDGELDPCGTELEI